MTKIRLIENWRESYKLLSMKVLGLIFIFPDVYSALSNAGYLEGAPVEILICMKVLAGIGMVARLIKQNNKDGA